VDDFELNTSTITLRPFHPHDQQQAQSLILAGLEEHWGRLDPALNPDLQDIAASYADAIFLVAECDGRIVGTGALTNQTAEQAEIVRMSVAADMRRQGVGRLILDGLTAAARRQGVARIALETTADWQEVVAFYQRCGFQLTHFSDSPFGREAHFCLTLSDLRR
jgi:N-acetylglutamate synthase-like GNAT family acetyltransferase